MQALQVWQDNARSIEVIYWNIEEALNLCDKLLERYKVAAVPGIAFGNDKAIRISYCTTLDILKEALDRFEEFCKAH